MEKTSILYQTYIQILSRELVPAMGCTEPIAIAYASAKARETLGTFPTACDIAVSGNIIKNAKSVVVPHTGGMKGIETAVLAGIVAGNADAISFSVEAYKAVYIVFIIGALLSFLAVLLVPETRDRCQ